MAGGPRATKKKPISRIGEAARFVLPASKPDGIDYQQYIRLIAGSCIAFDGVIAAGFPIEEELTLAPHAGRLVAALDKCGLELTIAELPTGNLSIKGGKLRAVVPCAAPSLLLPPVMPDPNIAVVNDSLKEGFKALGVLASDRAETMVEAALLLQANSMVSTNRLVMMEYWHGIDLPPAMVIPKAFAKAVSDCPYSLVGFGYGPSSITLWFDNGAWMKTQLYIEKYPDYGKIMNVDNFPVICPDGIWEALEAVKSFVDNDTIFLTTGMVATSADNDGSPGAGHECDGLEIKGRRIFAPSLLRLIKNHCEVIDFNTHHDRAVFFGGNVRGVIMGKS